MATARPKSTAASAGRARSAAPARCRARSSEGATGGPPSEARLLVVEYLLGGRDGPRLGWAAGGWSVRFPAGVLSRDLGIERSRRLVNGLFLVEGRQLGSQFVVDRVRRREPIVAADGAVLVSAWPAGAPAFTRRWEARR
jgi:hypothetical protein